MSLYVYHSNHLDILQKIVGHIMQTSPIANPFDKEYILIQNFGMAKWMQTELASQLGILAQTECLLPSKMLINLFEILFSGEENNLQNLSKERLYWPLVTIIYELKSADDDFMLIHHYIDHKDPLEKLRKTMVLAEQIAAIFDKYIVHRSDWIAKWDQDELVNDANLPDIHQRWQKKLWTLVRNYLNNPIHFGNIKPLIEAKLQQPEIQCQLPSRLFIIGLTSLPPLFLDLLVLFSNYIDIHLFFNNPSQFYWGDLTKYGTLPQLVRTNYYTQKTDDNYISPHTPTLLTENWQDYSGNPLLASLGKVGRDHLYLIQQYEHQEIEAFSEPTPQSLLGALHHALFNLLPIEETEPYLIAPDDRSISIHQSYSPMREIESLYDQLLHMFNTDLELLPSDIVIMMPDIENYEALIHAVFGNADSERFIPYSVSDVSLKVSEPILDGFLTLLSLPEMTFKANEIINILKLPEVSAKFEIEEQDIELIVYWVQEAAIRFGSNKQHITQLGFRQDEKNTWLWGLKRMLLGYATKQSQPIDGILPFPNIQGMDALIVGKLIQFIETLLTWQSSLSHTKLLEDWLLMLSGLWNDFFISNEDTQLKLNFVLHAWQKIIENGLQIDFSYPVPLKSLVSLLETELNDEKPLQNFIQGKVTFCSFVPMRAIPFKIVCLIGLNQEDFPKSSIYHDFDLMQYQPYRGDRTRHNDDRYLFLEAILSAQNRLYLSYINRSIQDNTERLPSLLIDELVNYLSQIVDTSNLSGSFNDHLFIQHPLASYSSQLFNPIDERQSFQKEWIQSTTTHYATPYEFSPAQIETIHLHEWIRFYQDPSTTFSQKRLDLRPFYRNTIEIDDHESFGIPAGLTRYQYRKEIVEQLLKSELQGEYLEKYAHHELQMQYEKRGILPKFAYQSFAWTELITPCLELVHRLHEDHYQQHYSEFSFSTEGITLQGELPTLNNNLCILWDVGALNLKRKIRAFLIHLAHHVQGHYPTTKFFTIDKETVHIHEITPFEPQLIPTYFENYFYGYQLGLTYPLFSFEETPNATIMTKINEQLSELNITDIPTVYTQPLVAIQDKIADHSELLQQLKSVEAHIEKHTVNHRLFPIITLKEVILYCLFYQHYLTPIV